MNQAAFAAALLDPDLPLPLGVVDPAGMPAQRRFNIYRNSVTQGLGAALETGFPAVLALVGPAFFRAMALRFLREHPPRGRIMMLYGAEFADFIAGFAPAQGLGYLADVARLEQALRESYHAADATALPAAQLTQMSEAQLLQARFRLAPSLRLLRSDWPVSSIWAAALGFGPPPSQMRAEHVMIARKDFDPKPQVLSPEAYGFVAALEWGAPLHLALAQAGQELDLGQVLALLIAADALVGVSG